MRVLVTTDTFSGVWTYTRELVSGLVTQVAQVILVSFGEIPLPHQTSWMQGLHGLEYHPTAFRLDWMQEGEQDSVAGNPGNRATTASGTPAGGTTAGNPAKPAANQRRV